MQCSPFLAISWEIIIFCTKVGVDNRNPVKTSNINKPGATPQNFCTVCVIAEPKN